MGEILKRLNHWWKKIKRVIRIGKPGWLNDKIIDVYLSLLEKECVNMEIKCFAFNTQFITKLRSVELPKDGQR